MHKRLLEWIEMSCIFINIVGYYYNFLLQIEKIYVQDRIKETGAMIWELLHKKSACLYISG